MKNGMDLRVDEGCHNVRCCIIALVILAHKVRRLAWREAAMKKELEHSSLGDRRLSSSFLSRGIFHRGLCYTRPFFKEYVGHTTRFAPFLVERDTLL